LYHQTVPLFLDRHSSVTVSPEEVAVAHAMDVEFQHQHGVNYHTYWFDQDRGTVFCLAEGPNRESIDAVHRESHGLAAEQIVEVPFGAPLNELLGQMPDHPVGTAYTETAMRAIVFTDMCDSVGHTEELGDEGHVVQLEVHDDVVRRSLAAHGGREVKHTGDGIMASFNTSASAIAFAAQVQGEMAARDEHSPEAFSISIGISAGEPLTRGSDDLFGATVQYAARICAFADPAEILVSSVVRELCVGKKITFLDRGEVSLKGVSEPVHVFAVEWGPLVAA
jgi:class 3 adenylate cyclase